MLPQSRFATRRHTLVLALALALAVAGTQFVPAALAVPLHVNADNKTCDIEFSSNLTQGAFARFTREIGDIVVYKNDGAPVMPAGRVELGLAYSGTPVDQNSSAWNDTFTHPHADHPLGDAIALPMLYGRAGLGRDLDLGAYFSGNPDARYRLIGAGLKHGLGSGPRCMSRLAVSLDYGLLFGPHDTNVNALGMDLHAGRDWRALSMYSSAGATWSHATESSPVVDLDTENTVRPHVAVGVSPHLWRHLNVDLRARFASVNTFDLRLGHTM